MTAPVTVQVFTPDDLLTMPEGDRYELVDGLLVERKMSYWPSFVAGRIYRFLAVHAETNELGWVAPEGTSYRCFPDAPEKVRRPDASFHARERLSPEIATSSGHLAVSPDLAVEVVSPHDTYYEVDQKVNEWLEAGVRLLWVINPETRRARVYRADRSDGTVQEGGELSGEDVVPGFRCRLGDLFRLPPGVAPPA